MGSLIWIFFVLAAKRLQISLPPSDGFCARERIYLSLSHYLESVVSLAPWRGGVAARRFSLCPCLASAPAASQRERASQIIPAEIYDWIKTI